MLTRDTALLKRKKNIFVRRVRADLPYDQVSEVVHLFGLEQKATVFSNARNAAGCSGEGPMWRI